MKLVPSLFEAVIDEIPGKRDERRKGRKDQRKREEKERKRRRRKQEEGGGGPAPKELSPYAIQYEVVRSRDPTAGGLSLSLETGVEHQCNGCCTCVPPTG